MRETQFPHITMSDVVIGGVFNVTHRRLVSICEDWDVSSGELDLNVLTSVKYSELGDCPYKYTGFLHSERYPDVVFTVVPLLSESK